MYPRWTKKNTTSPSLNNIITNNKAENYEVEQTGGLFEKNTKY
jgi:hypothetical protein